MSNESHCKDNTNFNLPNNQDQQIIKVSVDTSDLNASQSKMSIDSNINSINKENNNIDNLNNYKKINFSSGIDTIENDSKHSVNTNESNKYLNLNYNESKIITPQSNNVKFLFNKENYDKPSTCSENSFNLNIN